VTADSPSISKENVYLLCLLSSLYLMALFISFSKTNCLANIFMAFLIAFLNKGPDKFFTTFPKILLVSSGFSSTILPVSKKVIDEIFTNRSLSFLIYFSSPLLGFYLLLNH